LANSFKDSLVSFRLLGALPLAPPQAKELSLSTSASKLSLDRFWNGEKSTVSIYLLFLPSAAGQNCVSLSQVGDHPGMREGYSSGVELDNAGRMTT